jgi:hypothetical protein
MAGAIPGGAIGGYVGGRALTPPAAAAPKITYDDLKASADRSYDIARNSGIEIGDKGFALGYAKPTTDALQLAGLKNTAPASAIRRYVDKAYGAMSPGQVNAGDLSELRSELASYSRELDARGAPTRNSAAASQALPLLNKYLENLHPSHVVSGDVEKFLAATRAGNADYAAAQRLRPLDTRIAKAELAADRTGNLAGKLQNTAGQILNPVNPKLSRGYNDQELAGAQSMNRGAPLPLQLASKIPGVPLTLPGIAWALYANHPELAAAAALYGGAKWGAGKLADRAVMNKAQGLRDLIASRSPYAQGLPIPQPKSVVPFASGLRGAMLGMQ